jgi:hypothetical protein
MGSCWRMRVWLAPPCNSSSCAAVEFHAYECGLAPFCARCGAAVRHLVAFVLPAWASFTEGQKLTVVEQYPAMWDSVNQW